MQRFLLSPPLLALLLLGVSCVPVVVALVINTPSSLTTCQNVSLTWTGAAPGNAFISLVPGGLPSATPLKQFEPVDGSTETLRWLVDQPAGTSLTIIITDATGATTGTAPVTVTQGVDTSCVGHGTSTPPAAEPKTSSSPSVAPATSGSNAMTKDTTHGTTITPPATQPKNVSTTPPPTSSTSNVSHSTNTSKTTTPAPAGTGSDGAVAVQHQIVVAVVALGFVTLFMAF